ncbi:hypothetical protein ACJX0J_040296, partial [Zea mays]
MNMRRDWMVLSLCLVREMSIQIKLRSYPTSISMFKEKHKKMSLDCAICSLSKTGICFIIVHSHVMIQIKQYCLQKLKTAYNLQVWQAVKHKTVITLKKLQGVLESTGVFLLSLLLNFAFPSFLSKTFWKEV